MQSAVRSLLARLARAKVLVRQEAGMRRIFADERLMTTIIIVSVHSSCWLFVHMNTVVSQELRAVVPPDTSKVT